MIPEEYPDQPSPMDIQSGQANTIRTLVAQMRSRQWVHHYIERDVAIEKLESALYWLDRLRQRQQEESLGAK